MFLRSLFAGLSVIGHKGNAYDPKHCGGLCGHAGRYAAEEAFGAYAYHTGYSGVHQPQVVAEEGKVEGCPEGGKIHRRPQGEAASQQGEEAQPPEKAPEGYVGQALFLCIPADEQYQGGAGYGRRLKLCKALIQ